MTEILNLCSMAIADKVQRHMMANYYTVQLEALQDEAKRLGYYFASTELAAITPSILVDCLAYAVDYRRRSYLYPRLAPEEWERITRDAIKDGYPQVHVRDLLTALEALGVRIQESPEALELITCEESRERRRDADTRDAYIPELSTDSTLDSPAIDLKEKDEKCVLTFDEILTKHTQWEQNHEGFHKN